MYESAGRHPCKHQIWLACTLTVSLYQVLAFTGPTAALPKVNALLFTQLYAHRFWIWVQVVVEVKGVEIIGVVDPSPERPIAALELFAIGLDHVVRAGVLGEKNLARTGVPLRNQARGATRPRVRDKGPTSPRCVHLVLSTEANLQPSSGQVSARCSTVQGLSLQ